MFWNRIGSLICHLSISNSVRQSGNYPNYSSGTLWPPFRLPIATHPNYEDPRKVLLSKTFHAILFVLLYKAIHAPTLVSEQSLALLIYLLDMAVSLAHQSISQGNVSTISLCFTSTICLNLIYFILFFYHINITRLFGNTRRFVSVNQLSIYPTNVLIFSLVNGSTPTVWPKTWLLWLITWSWLVLLLSWLIAQKVFDQVERIPCDFFSF